MKLVQLVIHSREVSVILGQNIRTSRKLLRTIKDVYDKQPHEYVTIKEFCEYMGLPYDEVMAMINGY